MRSDWLPVLAAVALAGCGRVGFDEVARAPDGLPGEPDADSLPDGNLAPPFDPATGNCAEAEAGPFVEVARVEGIAGYGVWSAPPFVLVADTTGSLHSYRFDGTSFTETSALTGLGFVEAVWSDGTVFYVGVPGTGLFVVALDAAGGLTILAEDRLVVPEARRGWVSDDVVYVPAGSSLHAMTFDGTSLQPLATTPTASFAQGAWSSGRRVLFADGSVFRVLDFDGTGFTDLFPPVASHAGNARVWSDGDVLFTANADGISAARLVGAQLAELATFATDQAVRDVWSDGQHVFGVTNSGRLYALAFDGTALTLVDSTVLGEEALGVHGDGEVIFATDLAEGLRAYGGFRCRATR